MATASVVSEVKYVDRNVVKQIWTFITGLEGHGNPFSGAAYPDKSIQFSGASGGTSSVVIEGSNDDAASGTYHTLADPQGNVLTAGNSRVEAVLENTRWIRPRASTVTAGSSIVVSLIAKG